MLLSSLFGPAVPVPDAAGGVRVAGLTADSRLVRPGFVFVAIAGAKVDGARFIEDAVSKGLHQTVVNSCADGIGAPSHSVEIDPFDSRFLREVLRYRAFPAAGPSRQSNHSHGIKTLSRGKAKSKRERFASPFSGG